VSENLFCDSCDEARVWSYRILDAALRCEYVCTPGHIHENKTASVLAPKKSTSKHLLEKPHQRVFISAQKSDWLIADDMTLVARSRWRQSVNRWDRRKECKSWRLKIRIFRNTRIFREKREREREGGGGEFHASRVRSLYYHSGAESHDTDSIASLVAVKRRCERWLPVARYAEPIFRT